MMNRNGAGSALAPWWMGALLFAGVACSEDDKNTDPVEDAGDTGDAAQAADSGTAKAAPTWHQDVAPLVASKCVQCHKDGGIAPFSLESYDAAKPFAKAMAASVEAGTMPPFLAKDTDECTPRLGWIDDLRLSDEQKSTLRAWADAEAPKGDKKTAAPLEPAPKIELEREDVVMKVPETISVEGTKDMHTCVVVDPGVEEDTYVTERLIVPGNPEVLHHVVSYVILPGENEDGTPRSKAQLEEALLEAKGVGIGDRYDCFGGPGLDGDISTEMLDAWAPGGVPNRAPKNSGQPLSKDALVLLDMHYHPTGKGEETDDSTYLALTITDEAPAYISRVILLGNFSEAESDYGVGIGRLLKTKGESEPDFVIPAGEEEHIERMEWTWQLDPLADLRAYSVSTHMHYVGYDMLIELENVEPKGEEPDKECLLQTPAWDFNWQRGYGFDGDLDELPSMVDGDTLHLRCKFNNSLSNPHVKAALADQGLDKPIDVRLGEDTLDEMCLAAVGIMYPNVGE